MHTITVADHEVFRALGDPTRLRVAVLLSTRELCVCELTAILQLPQSSVSRHMATLRSAGLVTDRREGRWIHYRLAEPLPLPRLMACLQELAAQPPHCDDLAALQRQTTTQGCAS